MCVFVEAVAVGSAFTPSADTKLLYLYENDNLRAIFCCKTLNDFNRHEKPPLLKNEGCLSYEC